MIERTPEYSGIEQDTSLSPLVEPENVEPLIVDVSMQEALLPLLLEVLTQRTWLEKRDSLKADVEHLEQINKVRAFTANIARNLEKKVGQLGQEEIEATGLAPFLTEKS